MHEPGRDCGYCRRVVHRGDVYMCVCVEVQEGPGGKVRLKFVMMMTGARPFIDRLLNKGPQSFDVVCQRGPGCHRHFCNFAYNFINVLLKQFHRLQTICERAKFAFRSL